MAMLKRGSIPTGTLPATHEVVEVYVSATGDERYKQRFIGTRAECRRAVNGEPPAERSRYMVARMSDA